MGLEILLVCRQVHAEAALIPYQENTFQLRGAAGLRVFMERLMPAQSRALQRINIMNTDHNRFWDDLGLKAQLKKDLVSLKSFEFFVEFGYGCDFKDAGPLIPYALRTFEKVKMEHVSIGAYYEPADYDDYPLPTREQLNKWASTIEEMLKTGEGWTALDEDDEDYEGDEDLD